MVGMAWLLACRLALLYCRKLSFLGIRSISILYMYSVEERRCSMLDGHRYTVSSLHICQGLRQLMAQRLIAWPASNRKKQRSYRRLFMAAPPSRLNMQVEEKQLDEQVCICQGSGIAWSSLRSIAFSPKASKDACVSLTLSSGFNEKWVPRGYSRRGRREEKSRTELQNTCTPI